MAVTTDLSACCRPVLIIFYSQRNQTTSCQYKLSKTLVHRIIDAQ